MSHCPRMLQKCKLFQNKTGLRQNHEVGDAKHWWVMNLKWMISVPLQVVLPLKLLGIEIVRHVTEFTPPPLSEDCCSDLGQSSKKCLSILPPDLPSSPT
ncbi:hypothetical protein Lal_00017885 [Lupinus albus]|nr:hypothetical protein Lal_00017885 [Lupinus albus]